MSRSEEKLRALRSEVSKAVETLKAAHTGANVAEGRRLLQEAAEAVRRDAWDQALSLAQKAQLAAKPTTEYLLARAKNLEASGSQAYRENRFSEAMELWRKALEEYGKAKEVAVERKEEEILRALAPVAASIDEDIRVAERDKANAEMLAMVEEANKATDEAKEAFEAGKFDRAKAKFESARDLYAKGAKIAEAFHFEDKSRLAEAEAEMGASSEACLLAKGEALIDTASKEKGSKKEEAFSQAIAYLESFSSGAEKYDELKNRAHRGLVRGRIEIGTGFMEDAEAVLTKREYYQAKEGYRKAQSYFETLRDFAVEHRLEREKGEVDRLIDDCTANIRVCTDSMLGREKVATGNVRKVEDIRRGIRVQTREERLSEDKIGKLEKVYTSIRYLDSGGFGDVFLAQTKEGQIIALKVLREPERDQHVFFKELEVWGKLVHRNIVRLIRPVVSPAPLFEMEYVDGGDLKALMQKDAPFVPERACRIAFDIARGLAYAHSSNVIHGDLKPRNILLTKTEEVKISDWGLGKVATSSSKSLGYTPGYAAPEQVRKESPDKMTDVYQLGLVFYEMLVGTNPFDSGSLAEKDEKALTLVPQKPSRYNPRVKALDDLVLGCLEKDPRNRPGTREFREVLSKHMTENYGVLLQVTVRTSERVGILCRNAMFAAKLSDHKECLRALKDLRSHLTEKGLKESVQSLMHAMEHREKAGIEITDEVLNDIDGVLRLIEYGES